MIHPAKRKNSRGGHRATTVAGCSSDVQYVWKGREKGERERAEGWVGEMRKTKERKRSEEPERGKRDE